MRRVFPSEFSTLLDVAREIAQSEGAEGLRFAWEQADFGKDVSPAEDVKRKKLHVTADVGFGLRSYLRMSHDRDFLLNLVSSDAKIKGEDLVLELSKYWNSKLVKNPNKNQYEIKEVLFGDQNQQREVNNEAFTNYMARINIDSYKYALRLTEK
jgi:alpha,alpha-trehalose phosphorylase